ncbi:M28 family peptidase [Roseivirga misakiensis]|uniref:Peptidase M28 n=1 Tax=Roseivirga misakiensis TaxID=1563681 RepID=A0A1E5SL64_9BACT|nr:M28 family peptidase [Roseivirga misakiensis]OEJ99864.1 peptidase M28 [Roseivirga misakiensis]
MKRVFLLLIAILLGTNSSVFSFQFDQFTTTYYNLADSNFDKESAYGTVSFVEKYFRVVGNSGFDKSIYHVVEKLKAAGYVEEKTAKSSDRLVYRIEKRALKNPTWEPVAGSLKLASGEEILNFETNFNMIAINSYSTNGEQDFDLVYVGDSKANELDDYDIKGKVIIGENSASFLFREGVQKRGAVGVISYRIPGYNQASKHRNSISFSSIPRDEEAKSFAILTSYNAYNKIQDAIYEDKYGLKINLETKIYPSEELTLVAEVRGSSLPEERFVFSAHVQEPGANDNASGVGVLMEVASSTAKLLKAGKVNPERTITYLFGDEITSTRRYIQEDRERAKNIKWGMSLDMVGQNTALTGGTFLIEKMPDPGAIWVRGVEKHSEWGGRPLQKKDLKPHYFNDLAIGIFEHIGEKKDWEVKFNPFEGGSDHVPFLSGNIPGLLLWHFTDEFYHTDGDRLDKVSKETLHNVGVGAMMISLMLTENKPQLADRILLHVSTEAAMRLTAEARLSQFEVDRGKDKEAEKDILNTWFDYYGKVFDTTLDLNPKDKVAFQKNLSDTKSALWQLRGITIGKLK